MLLSKNAKVKWHYKNKDYFTSKGYTYTKNYDEFIVKIEDLQDKSASLVEVKCDVQAEGCKNIYHKKYADYIRNRNVSIIDNIDCCNNPNCMKEKRKMGLIDKYGVENSNQIPEAKEKRIATCLERYDATSPLGNKEVWDKIHGTNLNKYGVEHISQSSEIKNKKESTFLIRYGNTNPMKTKEFKLKAKKTNLERYGVSSYTKTDECKEKIKSTNIEKYGVEHLMQLDKVKEERIKKRVVTVYKNGTLTSTQQNYLNEILNGELNYPIGNTNLDIAFPNEKIYLEYNGSGHWLSVLFGDLSLEEFNLKEKKRQYFLNSQGWKLIRLNSRKDYLPNDDKIKEVFDFSKKYLLNNHSWIEIDIDSKNVNSSQFQLDWNFGELKKLVKSN